MKKQYKITCRNILCIILCGIISLSTFCNMDVYAMNYKDEETVQQVENNVLEEAKREESEQKEETEETQEVKEEESEQKEETEETKEVKEVGSEQEQEVEDVQEETKEEKNEQEQEINNILEEIKNEEGQSEIEQNSIQLENNINNEIDIEDDPQYGRANGYTDESFFGIHMLSSEEYIHNSKFNDYLIAEVIDVSKYQGDINWGKVKTAGVEYAFIRAGYRGYGEEGTLNTDSLFTNNIEQAINAGIQVGVYFFSQAVNENEAKEEAEYLLNLIKKYKISLPVVIDYEYASSSDGLVGRLYNANLSVEEATAVCKRFCSIVEEDGYTAMVYGNKDMLENRINSAEISKDYKIWLANYTTSTMYEGDYEFWQYTQNGTVDGITTNVDKSFWYKEKDKSCIYNGVDYSAVYNFSYYMEHYPDIKRAYGDNEYEALKHFVLCGINEGRQGNEDFNVYTYRNRYVDLRGGYRKNWAAYYIHYIKYGKNEGRSGKGTSELRDSITVYEGVDYSTVYDFKYYIERYPDIKNAYGDDDYETLKHFVLCGMKEGRQGNEEFNVQIYKGRYANLRTEYGNNLEKYYMHYINEGKKAGLSGNGVLEESEGVTVYEGVDYSAVYDFKYYIERYPDIKNAYGDDDYQALKHFVLCGMEEGRQGNEEFNVYTYRNRYADLRGGYRKSWAGYYMHYLRYGKNEGRTGRGASSLLNPVTVYNGVDYSAVYDFNYYIEHYSDIKKLYGDDDYEALKHFVLCGMPEGRQGNEEFNGYTYRNRYVDLRGGYRKNWAGYYMHYIRYGKSEGRTGNGTSALLNPVTVYNGVDYSAVYDFNYYIERYADIKNLYGDDDYEALKHFALCGMSEGRQGNEEFDVYTYKYNYKDLSSVYKDDLKKYYMHYIENGKNEGRSAIGAGRIKSCNIIKRDEDAITIALNVTWTKAVESYDEVYVVKIDPFENTISEGIFPIADSETASIEITIEGQKNIEAILMEELALAMKDISGNMKVVSNGVYVSNPEALAQNTTAIFKGTSKKGLQGITFTSLANDAGKKILDARNANTKHTLLNLDLATIVSPIPKAGFEAYTYKGNTYYFDELVSFRQSIESLNAGYKQYLYGNNDPTKVAVTICLLLSYNPETSYLIDPAARTPGHSYYMLNVREEKARETFEALFLYLGEAFGQENCYISNWILGNEINSSKAWNYSGSLDFDTYMECYATAFRLLYNGVKSTKTGNTVSISLDNGWMAAPDTYAGKTTLDTFAKKIHAQNPNIKWSIAYHPYSYPLTRVDFWNDYSNTTDSLSTRYISMRNISVLTNYAAALENSYGLPSGSIRVLLTEQGYSYSGGDQNQAMAIARGYYIAEFNDRIDAFIIRSVIDDPDEAQAKLYFGLMNRLQEKRIAFFVYEHMDSNIDQFKNISPVGYVSEDNYDKFNKAKAIVCNTNWSSIVPGFSKAKLANIK